MANKKATVDEFRAAFAALNRIERVGLGKLAKSLASGASGYTCGDDLLNEAVMRSLRGDRRWPLDVSIETFLANAMRSIVWAARASKEMSARDFHFDFDAKPIASPDAWQLALPTPEEIALRRERQDMGLAAIDFARSTLRGDGDGLNVLEGLAADLSGEEMREAFGLDMPTYRAARERVRYCLKAWNGGQRP